ncbi:MAG: sel1 repeat family protein [Clostridia bacterium]|nr:sel1 repeat family protein [Clostridia bacterium]
MKVIVKESYRQAETEFYKLPKKVRDQLLFFSCDDFISGKEYEVISIEKHGWYKIVDESGEDYLFPPEMFDIVDNSPCPEKKDGIGLFVKYSAQKDIPPLKKEQIFSVLNIDENENYVILLNGVPSSFPTECFEIMGWIDDSPCLNIPIVLYLCGLWEQEHGRFEEAFTLLKKGADMNDMRCKNALAECLACEDRIKEKAHVNFYNKLLCAKKGDAEAQLELGKCFEFGWGTEKNVKKAVKWYKKSAKQGNQKAISQLAYCYDMGIGVRKNPRKAKKLLNRYHYG